MAALRSRCGHYIFVLWFLLLSFSFFVAYSQPSQIGCLPYTHTWCGLSANLGCRSETCCTRLAEKYRTQKIAIWHDRTTLSGYISSQLRHVSTIGIKLVEQQYLLICPHAQYGELRPKFGPLTAEIS